MQEGKGGPWPRFAAIGHSLLFEFCISYDTDSNREGVMGA
jgi:hypothetical protein